MHTFYENLLQKIETDTSKENIHDFTLAREEFYKFTGKFNESEPWYEVRMTMFMDWYLLERKRMDGLTPNEYFLKLHQNNLDEQIILQLHYFAASLRSIFKIIKISGSEILLEDLINRGLWQTVWTLPLAGLQPGRIVNTRIINSKDTLFSGRGAVLHPEEAEEPIMAIIDRAISEQMPQSHISSYMDKINLKLNRYSNVKIRHVYQYPSDAVL